MPEQPPFQSRRRRQPTATRQPAQASQYSGFKRSRTLTGAASSKVEAASQRRGFLSSPRLKAQNLRKHRSLLFVAVLSSWLAVAGLVYLLDQYIGSVDINTPGISRQQALNRSIVEQVNRYFDGRPLERFRFAVDEPQLSRYLSQQISVVEAISFDNGDGLTSALATVELRQPVAKWQLGDRLYFVDADGQAFEDNYFKDPAVVVDDQSGLPPSDQQRLASAQLLSFIGRTVHALNLLPNSQVERIVIPPATLKQVDVRLKDKPYRLKLSTDREVAAQVADVEVATKYLDRRGQKPSYVDVRIAGKAYYR